MTDKERTRLLAEYTTILCDHGPDSIEEEEFRWAYSHDQELRELMQVSRYLKKALIKTRR